MNQVSNTIKHLYQKLIEPLAFTEKKYHRHILALFVALIVLKNFFSPTPLEEATDNQNAPIDPDLIVKEIHGKKEHLAPGIPKARIPEYAIEGFDFTSTQGKVKEWKLEAQKAYLYNKEQIVHGKTTKAYLFGSNQPPTIVTGQESKYFMGQRDLEVFGNVKTVFPDGFTLYSEYLHYYANKRVIIIPTDYRVHGDGLVDDEKKIQFKSSGIIFEFENNEIELPKDVYFLMERVGPKTSYTQGVSDRTEIRSEHCLIDRTLRIAHFDVKNKKNDVTVDQPEMHVIAKRVDLNYSGFKNTVNYMVAHDDVEIIETSEGTERRATCGMAEFDTQRNLIFLKKYPQVYQQNDTVTGDLMIIHRDKDLVEVKRSNAFSEGKTHTN
ncbi:MAG: LPS export ABC transporter periplasmic protein LptC [Bdellovibrionaceae bacterium]|nr:LPS export ABC transporter periplasmic protein LptC [Pseudobdellovibrionaceae bacterium]|tara:strand:- start:1848 stop:2990 length:1143 start_codon:yes stop_codon:yes gene_type:complete